MTMSDYVRYQEVVPGARFVDINSGPVVVCGKPRYVEGGYVVDVKAAGNQRIREWCACLVNLRRHQATVD
jgi:hypothetical protein